MFVLEADLQSWTSNRSRCLSPTSISTSVVDAKALYDLLVKDEIQAALGGEHCTAVEIPVAQDKVRVCRAQIKSICDGTTKRDAEQLFADRLRSRQLRLTSDTNFQAAKKKTASQRKKGGEMYAIEELSKALQAVTVATAITTTTTQSFSFTENQNDNLKDDSFTFTNLLLIIFFVMAFAHGIHLVRHLGNFHQPLQPSTSLASRAG